MGCQVRQRDALLRWKCEQQRVEDLLITRSVKAPVFDASKASAPPLNVCGGWLGNFGAACRAGTGCVLPGGQADSGVRVALPDVPSMREAGVADYEVGGWFGIYGPASLPVDLIARYNEATRKALANDELKNKLVEQGYDIWSGPPQVLSERAARELALWGPVTKGIPVQ